jgi:outer membrane protein TolC
VVGAQETASGTEVEASLLDLNQTVSDLLFNTAVSYWSAVAAKRSLDVFSQAEARGKLLLDTVQALIQADRIPRSDAAEVEANLADRSASRIAAEQQYLQATQQLAVAMGVSTENIPGAREPNDPLPPATEMALVPGEVPAIITNALTHRADFLATKKRLTEAEALAGAARNQLRPQVDLQLTSGYSGLKDGTNPDQYLASPFGGVHGIDAVAGIRYSFPLENRAAQGSVMQARSTLAQADYRSQDTARNIASSVVVAVQGVRSAVQQLEKVNQSVLHFQTALDNEREKYRLGVGSLVEVLTVEDRLTGVLTSQVQAELGYAVAVARLRQATGTIVAPDKAVQQVDPAVFLTMPEAPH